MIWRKRNQEEGPLRVDIILMISIPRSITMVICRSLKLIRHPILTINLLGTNPKASKTNSYMMEGIITNQLFISLFNNKIQTICLTKINNT